MPSKADSLEPRSVASDERGPVLFTTADTESWRERIKKEVETSSHLRSMLAKAERQRRSPKAGFAAGMPTPPTTFASVAARLSTSEKREQAARSMKALNGEWPSGSTYDMALRIHTFADPPSPTSRDEPWRP